MLVRDGAGTGRRARLNADVPPRPDVAPEHRGPSVPWHPAQAVAIFLLGAVLGGLLSAPVLAATQDRPVRFAALLVTGEVGLAASVLLWVRFVNRAPLSALGAPRDPARDVGAGLLAGVAIVVAGSVAVFVEQAVARQAVGHQLTSPAQVPDYVSGAVLWIVGPAVILAAPFGEELLFRGFLYRGLRSRLPVWPSILVSAVLFGLVHMVGGLSYWPIVPPLVVVGIGLAFVYERRQSVLASMTAHAVFNVVGFIAILLARGS